jgi:hypothetical protein
MNENSDKSTSVQLLPQKVPGSPKETGHVVKLSDGGEIIIFPSPGVRDAIDAQKKRGTNNTHSSARKLF